MNLKTACTLAIAITLAALAITILGRTATFFPLMTGHFHISIVLHSIIPTALCLLQIVGLIIALLAVSKRLSNAIANTQISLILAGCLTLIPALLNAILAAIQCVNLAHQMPAVMFALYAVSSGLMFLSGTALGLFFLTQAASKPLAGFALAAKLALLAVNIINLVIQSSNFWSPSFIRSLGLTASWAGWLLSLAAVILFLLAFLITPKQPTAAETEFTQQPDILA